MADFFTENGFIVIFILWCLFLSLTTDAFLEITNLLTILKQSSIIAIVAAGVNFVMLLGELDISVASAMGLAGIISAITTLKFGLTPVLTVVIGMFVGVSIGVINGLLVTRIKINSVVTTLGMMSILEGIGFILTKGRTIYGQGLNDILFIAQDSVGPIPIVSIFMIIVYAITYFILNHTVFGARIYAVGDDSKSAWLSGIKVTRVILLAFLITGLLAGFGGILQMARQASASGGLAADMLFPILTAVLLGGTSLSGGRGKIQNTLIASIFLASITNGMILIGVSIYFQKIISGAILILALSLERLRGGDWEF